MMGCDVAASQGLGLTFCTFQFLKTHITLFRCVNRATSAPAHPATFAFSTAHLFLAEYLIAKLLDTVSNMLQIARPSVNGIHKGCIMLLCTQDFWSTDQWDYKIVPRSHEVGVHAGFCDLYTRPVKNPNIRQGKPEGESAPPSREVRWLRQHWCKLLSPGGSFVL